MRSLSLIICVVPITLFAFWGTHFVSAQSLSTLGAVDSLDDDPEWMNSELRMMTIGMLRYGGWEAWSQSQRDSVLRRLPLHGLRKNTWHHPQQRTRGEEVRLLAWSKALDTFRVWFGEDTAGLRVNVADHAFLWVHFRDSIAGELWGLMLASSVVALDSPRIWRMADPQFEFERLRAIRQHKKLRRDRWAGDRSVRLFDHPPSNAEALDFLAASTASRPGPGTLSIDWNPEFAAEKRIVASSVQQQTWRLCFGEMPPISFPEE